MNGARDNAGKVGRGPKQPARLPELVQNAGGSCGRFTSRSMTSPGLCLGKVPQATL